MSILIAQINTFTSAYAQSDFFGKLIFFGLFILSLVCWVVILQKSWQVKQVKAQAKKFCSLIQMDSSSILQQPIDPILQESPKQVPNPYWNIFQVLKSKTLVILEKNHFFAKSPTNNPSVYLSRADIELIETHLSMTIQKQKETLEKSLFILPTITTLAPFLGLLGTVWGILVTFGGMQIGGQLQSNNLMLGGLSTALATTVLGLLIAIPSLVGYNYLKSSIYNIFSDMEDFGHQLLSTLELQYRKVDVD